MVESDVWYGTFDIGDEQLLEGYHKDCQESLCSSNEEFWYPARWLSECYDSQSLPWPQENSLYVECLFHKTQQTLEIRVKLPIKYC